MSKKTSKQIFHTIFATCPTLTSSSEDSSESDAFSCWDGWRAKVILERSGCSGVLWLKASSSVAEEQWLLSKHVWHPDGKCLFFCGFWTSNLFSETNHDRTTQTCKSRLKKPCHNFRLIHRVKLWQGKQTSSKSWKSEVPSYVVTGIAPMGLLAVQLLIWWLTYIISILWLVTVSLANWTNTPDPCPHSSDFLAGASSRHIILIQTRSLTFSIRLGPAKHTLVNPNPKESDWVTTVWNNPSWTSLHGRQVPFMCTKHLNNFCRAPWQTAYSTQQLLERKEILTSSSCSTKREDILERVPFRVWWTVYFNVGHANKDAPLHLGQFSILRAAWCFWILPKIPQCKSKWRPWHVPLHLRIVDAKLYHPPFWFKRDAWLGGPVCCLKKSGQDMICGTIGLQILRAVSAGASIAIQQVRT